jgi:hypothetical protein
LLTPGATLDSGALGFSNFAYTSTGDMPQAANITVSAYTDSAGHAGIALMGSFEGHDHRGSGSEELAALERTRRGHEQYRRTPG